MSPISLRVAAPRTPAKREAQRGIVGLLDPNGPTMLELHNRKLLI
jgi:hypothetical protein